MNTDETLLSYLNPACQYPTMIFERGWRRGWGITESARDDLASRISTDTHKNLTSLVGVDIWLRHCLHYNSAEALEWIGYSILEMGLNYQMDYDLIKNIGLYSGNNFDERRLGIVDINFNELNQTISESNQLLDQTIPNCVSLWFLALNPRLCLLANNGILVKIRDPIANSSFDITVIYDEAEKTVRVKCADTQN